jgi:hypothetical protein
MPGVQWNVTDALNVTQTRSWAANAANMLRVDDWMFFQYGPTDPVTGDPEPDTPANRAISVDNWILSQKDGLLSNVERHEKIVAAEDAAGNVPPLPDP